MESNQDTHHAVHDMLHLLKGSSLNKVPLQSRQCCVLLRPDSEAVRWHRGPSAAHFATPDGRTQRLPM